MEKEIISFHGNPLLRLTALVLHPNGWCIEGEALQGRSLVPCFWLELQKSGWLHFELVRPACKLKKGTWIATEYRSGDCPDPGQSISLTGVLWVLLIK